MKIYTVMGSTGDYGDEMEWPIVSYLNKEMAEKHVIKAKEKAAEWEKCYTKEFLNPPEGWSKYDPDSYMDHNGADYFISETELVDGDELWQVKNIVFQIT